MMPNRLLLVAGLLLPGHGVAPARAGDREFCRRYADAAATVAEDAIALDRACLDPGKGVHPDRPSHAECCARTPPDKVEGAATHIARLASRCTRGVLAEPTEYGGFAVAGVNERLEHRYGSARGWEIRSASSGRTFMYCVAVAQRKGRDVRIGFDATVQEGAGQWQLAVPLPSRSGWEGTLEVDGKGVGGGGGKSMAGTSLPGWTIVWLSGGEVDGLRKGRTALLGIGKQDFDLSLDGAAAALLKVEECRSRKGVVAASAAPGTARAAVRPNGQMITPDLSGASQSCIGPRDGRWVAGARLVLRNCRPEADRGFSSDNGEVTAVAGPLCAATAADQASLELGDCSRAPLWTWTASAGAKSAPILAPDGRCWTIPALGDPAAVFPFPVVAAPCPAGRKPPLGFFFGGN